MWDQRIYSSTLCLLLFLRSVIISNLEGGGGGQREDIATKVLIVTYLLPRYWKYSVRYIQHWRASPIINIDDRSGEVPRLSSILVIGVKMPWYGFLLDMSTIYLLYPKFKLINVPSSEKGCILLSTKDIFITQQYTVWFYTQSYIHSIHTYTCFNLITLGLSDREESQSHLQPSILMI